jgi:TolA-binding protein
MARANGLASQPKQTQRQTNTIRLRWAAALAMTLIVGTATWVSFKKDLRHNEGLSPTLVAEVTLVDSAIGHTLQPGPNEVYELVQGLAEFKVRHLAAQQRYRVLVGDDQVEVRGTRFQVLARQRHLESVRVFEGRVQVTTAGRSLTLDAGQRWVSELPAEQSTNDAVAPPDAEPVQTSVASSGPSRAEAPRAIASVKTPSPNPDLFDVAFSAALARLRSGDARGAVTELETLRNTSGIDSGRKSDVLYWSGVASHRSGNDSIAEQRLRQLLSSQSNSWHAPEAALLLGEILLTRGAPQLAKPWFERAAQSNRPKTSDTAKRHLDQMSRK